MHDVSGGVGSRKIKNQEVVARGANHVSKFNHCSQKRHQLGVSATLTTSNSYTDM